jgi:hypothetical protein
LLLLCQFLQTTDPTEQFFILHIIVLKMISRKKNGRDRSAKWTTVVVSTEEDHPPLVDAVVAEADDQEPKNNRMTGAMYVAPKHVVQIVNLTGHGPNNQD